MKKQFTLISSSLLLACSSLFTACNKDEAKVYAQLNIVNASPDAPNLDFWIDDVKFNSSVLYFGAHEGYLPVVSGTKILKINTMVNVFNTVIDSTVGKASMTLSDNKNHTLFVVDSFYKKSTLLVQDNFGTPNDGHAYFRFIQLAPNAPHVDVAIAGTNTLVYSDLAFKDVTAFKDMYAGVYNLDVRSAGTNTVLYTLPAVVFNSGKVYTVYTKGFVGQTGKQALSSDVFVNKW